MPLIDFLRDQFNKGRQSASSAGFNKYFLPSLAETPARLPSFSGNGGGAGSAARFVGNLGVDFVNNVVGRGIIDPTIDLGQNIGRTIQGRDPLLYDQARSPITRLGYNLSGQNRTPQQIIGNIAGAGSPIVDAYTGGKGTSLLRKPGATLLSKINEGARIGGKAGLTMGGLQGLEQNMDQSLTNQLTGGAIGAVQGLVAGRILGGTLPVLGAAGAGAIKFAKDPNKAISLVRNAIQDTPRQLTDPSLVPSDALASNFNLPGFRRKVRFNDPSLSKELDVGDSLFKQKDGTWAIKKAGRKAEEIANAQAVNDKYADTLEQYGYGSFRRNQDGSMTFTPKNNIATLETRLPEVPDNRVFVRTEPRAKGQLVDPSKSLKLKGSKIPPLPKIPDKIMKTQQGAEVWREMADSLAGKRIYAQDADKWISQKSTFPDWVSESLHSRKLFDQVQKHLLDGTTPKRGSQAGDLYQEVWARMAGDSKILNNELPRVNSNLEPSLDDLNATLPNKINLTGKVRKVKTDPEFESLIKSVTQEERFDRAINFGKMRSEGTPVNPLLGDGQELKDISSIDASFKSVHRIFKKVFGGRYDSVKKSVLDPFDTSKGKWIDEQNNIANDLKKNIIDRLGIKPKSKESALVQRFGEKEISLEQLKQQAPQKWQQIVEADNWFRNRYDTLLDEVNAVRAQIYGSNSEKIIPKRQDYYRHFQELNGFEGLMNRLTGPSNIPTELAGLSDSGTKPKSKFLSFAQKRLTNQTEYDAVTGFLQYVKSASYAKHIDPHINTFRKLAEDMRTTSVATDNPMLASRFTEFLEDYSNSLSGKTNPIDRSVQKVIGRPIMSGINWLNSRVKANVILGNLSSSVAQAGNLPQMAANAGWKNFAKGTGDVMLGINKPGKAINQSTFIKERYAKDIVDRFDTSLFSNPKKATVWVTQALDELSTKAGWHAFYRQAQEQGIKNPVKYADDLTRDMVGGRGIGEMPLAQQSRTTQLIAPFMLEVQNLWHVLGDNVGKKEFGKIVKFALGAYLFNRVAEQIRGTGVTIDFIDAFADASETYMEEDNKRAGAVKVSGRIIGEVLSNVMFGQHIAGAAYDEYGQGFVGRQVERIAGEKLTREEFFGEKDPTRFSRIGFGLIGAGAQDPLYKVLPPFGGNQLKKTIEGVKATNQGFSETANGRIRFPIDQNIRNRAQSALFGQYSVPEAREYFANNKTALGDEDSESVRQSSNPQEAISLLRRKQELSNQNKAANEQIKQAIRTYLDTGDGSGLAGIPVKDIQSGIKSIQKDRAIASLPPEAQLFDGMSKESIQKLVSEKPELADAANQYASVAFSSGSKSRSTSLKLKPLKGKRIGKKGRSRKVKRFKPRVVRAPKASTIGRRKLSVRKLVVPKNIKGKTITFRSS